MDVHAVAGLDAAAPQAPAVLPQGHDDGTSSPDGLGAQHAAPSERTLSSTIASLFGKTHDAQQPEIEVSYRLSRDHAIITVFTDSSTGKEVAQVPSDVLVQMSEFFDQHSGVTLDRSA